MKWRKLGLVFAPAGDRGWAKTHAVVPTPEVLPDGRIRIFFTALDDGQVGRAGCLHLSAGEPARVLDVSANPVLDVGEAGTFDDAGVNPSCVTQVGDRRHMYYIGWQRSSCVPYLLFGGLATACGEGAFVRHARVPVFERTAEEPWVRSAPMVIQEAGAFTAWYVAAHRWVAAHGKTLPEYSIRRATSVDGIRWEPAEVCIAAANEDEFGFGRPWVLRDPDRYRMWYSIRSYRAPYRIGYAESADGRTWTRDDARVGIERSSSGWDADMICYAAVVDAAGRRLMFYNGNAHGRSGFGVAVQEA